MEEEFKEQKTQKKIGDINLFEISSQIWISRKSLLIWTLATFILSALLTFSIPNKYKSSAILKVSHNLQNEQVGLNSSIGGLSLLGSGFNNPKLHSIAETLESWDFIDSYIDKYDKEVLVYAAQGWDKKNNKIIINSWLYDEDNNSWLIRNNDSNTNYSAPSSWKLFKRFSNYLNVYIDSSTGFITVSIEYYSPYRAKEWVEDIVKHLNDHIRDRELEVINKNVAYLQDQIEKTSLSYIREIFFVSIEEELKKKMFAEANTEYAVSYITRPMIPERKSSPSRTFISLLITAIVFFILCLRIIFIFNFPNFRNKKKKSYVVNRIKNTKFVKYLKTKLNNLLIKNKS